MIRILGLYSTFIILISQFLRDILVGSPASIMLDSLPNVDRILQILDDILLVRSFSLFELEDELFDKLVYIYRDPSYLIHITRDEDDDDDYEKGANHASKRGSVAKAKRPSVVANIS